MGLIDWICEMCGVRGKEHDEIVEILDQHESEMIEHARRLKALEAEVGIFKPLPIGNEEAQH